MSLRVLKWTVPIDDRTHAELGIPDDVLWTVIDGPRRGKWGILQVLARCVCGTERWVNLPRMRSGGSKGCGCTRAKTHGMTDSPEYRSWLAMRTRCGSPSHPHYARYGGRGITVCPEWQTFDAFYRDMGPRPEGTTLDRIDGDGNYEPGNCRWATPSAQNSNKAPRTHCKRNHEFTDENTYLTSDGSKRCRACHRDAERARQADRRTS